MRDPTRLRSEREDFDQEFDKTFKRMGRFAGAMALLTFCFCLVLMGAVIVGVIIAWNRWG